MLKKLKVLKWLLARYQEEYSLVQQVKSRFPQVKLENNVQIKGDFDNLHLEGKVIIQQNTVLHLGGYQWCENAGKLSIGAGSVISPGCIIYATGTGGVTIGKNFDCGPGTLIFSSRTDYARGKEHHLFRPVTIGDNVICFANVVISPGVTIGDGAVIAANSVITHDVPPYTMVGGSPARIIKKLPENEEDQVVHTAVH